MRSLLAAAALMAALAAGCTGAGASDDVPASAPTALTEPDGTTPFGYGYWDCPDGSTLIDFRDINGTLEMESADGETVAGPFDTEAAAIAACWP